MKGRTTRLSVANQNAAAAAVSNIPPATITAITIAAPPPPPSTTTSVSNSSPQDGQQQNVQASSPVENVRVTTTQHQISPEGGSPSTEQNPTSPNNPETSNPSTPANGNAIVSSSPQYVTITGEGSRSYASLTPVNPSVVDGDGSLETSEEGGFVYVEGSTEALYAASANGQTMTYPVYTIPVTDSTNMFTTQYYQSNGTSGAYSHESEVTYLIPTTTGTNTTNSSTMTSIENNEQNQNISHATRVSPQTVSWLLDNYETAEGVSLPRSTLYFHYLRHCQENKLDPVNAASFGKLIRSVFLGLRTRRLGTRGNSKYHYYGIRLKPSSPLNHVQVTEDGPPGANARVNTSSTGAHGPSSKRIKMKGDGHGESSVNGGDPVVQIQYLGDPSRVNLDQFPELDLEVQVPPGLTPDDLLIFRSLYRDHCETILDLIVNFHLNSIEGQWKSFWRTGEDSSSSHMSSQEYEKILPRLKLESLCSMQEIQGFIREADFYFYQSIVGILLPDVLRPIPSSMTQAIRNFAKGLESGLQNAMVGYSEEIVKVKLGVVNALAQTLRRYTSLNHLAQAARAVLQNQNQISQMLSDLNRVDFNNVEEQASFVCGCDGEIVHTLEMDFKNTLSRQQTLEEWAIWLESVVDRILQPHLQSPQILQTARHFLLKWSFYSSLVIRDLTLRSAASFGSFHLLRLLYDEYMFYLVEHRVAQIAGIVPISVIAKKSLEAEMKLNSTPTANGTQEGSHSSETTTPPQQSGNPGNAKVEVSKRVKNFI